MKYRALSLALFIAVAIVFFWQAYRKVQIDRLYSLASGEHALVQSSEAENAVIQLSQYTGNDVTELLLKIALGGEFGHRLRKRQRSVTVDVLIQTYGLRSEIPSPFALELAARIHLVEACPFLIRARRVSETIKVPPDKGLERTIQSLGCREQ